MTVAGVSNAVRRSEVLVDRRQSVPYMLFI
jgi:hypothetical protein